MIKLHIDKEKLLKFLESEMKNAPDHYKTGMNWVAYTVEKGTFDVESQDVSKPRPIK